MYRFANHGCLSIMTIALPLLVERNALILSISQRKVHILQALRGGALEQIVDCCTNNHALPAAMYCKAADLDAVLARNILDERRFANDLDELLAGIALLIEGADVARCHLFSEGD